MEGDCLIMNKYLKKAQDNLHIQAVNLKKGKVIVLDDIDIATLDRDMTMIQGYRAMTKVKEFLIENDEELFDYRFRYNIGLRIIFVDEEEESKKDDYKPVLEIVGNFEAQYHSNVSLISEELHAYSEQNVGYHVWPYWREYVQSSCARIGFSPALEVPVYLVNQENEKKDKKKKKAKKIVPKKAK